MTKGGHSLFGLAIFFGEVGLEPHCPQSKSAWPTPVLGRKPHPGRAVVMRIIAMSSGNHLRIKKSNKSELHYYFRFFNVKGNQKKNWLLTLALKIYKKIPFL